MKDLTTLREEIDRIDQQIVRLFEQRMNLAQEVARYKREHKTQVLQSGREQEVLSRAVGNLNDPAYEPQTRALMQEIMGLSKDLQRKITARSDSLLRMPSKAYDPAAKRGFFGEIGSNTQLAMSEIFGSDLGEAFDDFEELFRAADDGRIEYGVLPIENTRTGAINDVYDLLGKYNLYIVAEHWLKIQHVLWGTPESTPDRVETVFSHPQALQQCRNYLRTHGLRGEEYPNTAASAKMVSQSGNPAYAAIANRSAGERYGLKALADAISDCADNYTRFIVIAKQSIDRPCDKISLQFGMGSKAGALYQALRGFAHYGINLVMIESRPITENPCHYYFYIDVEGDLANENTIAALQELKEQTTVFKLLGIYPKGEIR